ncbi:hypothetical protein [Pseudomonas viridiflava]|uniref:hypothetical protein n=1 Tax=Pseudomonas viridiflava TaxID=33069 RepID=UPI000F071B19|nr:hypothetical protein [Pseudomonas viridiflava]
MKNWMLFGALLYLGGCASHHCENGPNDSQLTDSPCRAGHLLYQNDMLQAKLLISEDRENYELAEAMLRRAALDDASGEAEFYQAVLLIRQQADHQQIIDLLQTAAGHKHPLAIALLSQQLSISDPKRSEHYRNEYAELDVAKSGYPSFEQALVVIRGLVIPSAQATASN